MRNPADNLRQVLQGQLPEWIPVECLIDSRFGEGSYTFVSYQGALAPRAGGHDLWGVEWESTSEFLPYPTGHPASSLQRALELEFPDITDEELWTGPRAQVESSRNGSLVIARQVSLLFERYWSLVGMEAGLIGLVAEPDSSAELLERIANWHLSLADRYIAIGVEAARISDDYGTQERLLMSPRIWRKMIRPHLERIVGKYRNAGLPVILHSCGCLSQIMDDLIELQFSAINLQVNANDLVSMKKRYGRRLCIWGGVSTQAVMATGTPEDVDRAVQQAILTLGYDGGLVLEPDQVVQVPQMNLRAFYEAGQKYKALSSFSVEGQTEGSACFEERRNA